MRAARLAKFNGGGLSSTAPAISSSMTTAEPQAFAEQPRSSTLQTDAPGRPSIGASTSTTEPLVITKAPPQAKLPAHAQEQPKMSADTAVLAQLISMGFGREASKNVLDAAGGNIETAIDLLRVAELQVEARTTAQPPAEFQAKAG